MHLISIYYRDAICFFKGNLCAGACSFERLNR